MYIIGGNIMKKIKIMTPENIELEVALAEVLSRGIAAMIDGIIQGIIAVIIGCGFALIINKVIGEGSHNLYGYLVGGLIIIEAIILYGYYIYQETKMQGQTIGKRIMHLRVVRDNGSPATLKEVMIRNLFRIFIDNVGVGVVLMFLSKDNKRLGDKVAGTIVIVEEKQTMPIPLEQMIDLTDEIKAYLSKEEYSLLCEYFERKQTMTNDKVLREEIKSYFEEKFKVLGMDEYSYAFIQKL